MGTLPKANFWELLEKDILRWMPFLLANQERQSTGRSKA